MTTLFPLFKRYEKTIFLVLTIIVSCIILFPHLDYHDYLSSGDHGRDLLAAEQATQGLTTYIDYWWVYGPATPTYYGWFYQLFGTHMMSALIAKAFLKLLAAMFVFWGMSAIMPAFVGFMGATWFVLFQQDFFFTYNHAAGITCITAIVACLFNYLRAHDNKYLTAALLLCWLLSLIKVNFGFAALAFVIGSAVALPWFGVHPRTSNRSIFYLGIFVLPTVFVFQYIFWTLGLDIHEIRQCLPYLSEDHPHNTTPMTALGIFVYGIYTNILSTKFDMIMAALIHISIIMSTIYLVKRLVDPKQEKQLLLAAAMLGAYFVLNFHEFLVSGVWYRALWSQPLSTMLIILVIYAGSLKYPQWLKGIVWTTLIVMACVATVNKTKIINTYKHPQQYINHPRGKVYVRNDPGWINTLMTTTKVLEDNLKEDETFFALPYDPIYYYMTGKASPTRQTIFFEHINIPEEQEHKVIQELEENNVNWIVLSSRYSSNERGMGRLGHTYCPIMAKYIDDNFQAVARIGDWQNHPGWGWAHGTMIFKRKTLLNQ